MLPTRKKTIGGKTYTITVLSTWECFKGSRVLLKTIAPIMGEVLDSKNVDEDYATFNKISTFKDIMNLIAEDMEKPEIDKLIAKMLMGTSNDEGVQFNSFEDLDKDFRGKPALFMEFIFFLFEENFKDFFTENVITKSWGGMMKKVMQTGQSTEE